MTPRAWIADRLQLLWLLPLGVLFHSLTPLTDIEPTGYLG